MSGTNVEVHALNSQGSFFKRNISRCSWNARVHVANQNYSWVEPLLNVLLEPTDYCKGPFLVPKDTPELNLDFLLWKSE